MATFFIISATSAAWGLFLCCCRRWSYVCLSVVVEICWVGLSAFFGFLSMELGDGVFIFWAMVWLFVSAVELCLSIFGFILLADVRGAAGEWGA